MKRICASLLVVAFLFVACANKTKDENENMDRIFLVSVGDIEMQDSIYSIIKNYLDQYPQINTFLLTRSPIGNQLYSDGYLLGPAYEGINKDIVPLFYFQINDKQVFIQLGIESLMKKSKDTESLFFEKKIPKGIDSLVILPDWIIRGGDELYISRAIYFSQNSRGEIIVDYCPDTIFAPKLLESTIEFKNTE